MKNALPAPFLLLIVLNTGLQAQCPELQLMELHMLQRAEIALKQHRIQELGFDLRSEFVSEGESVRSYSRCWNGTLHDKEVFEQLIWWTTTANALHFMTLNEEHFRQLRASIVNRRSGKAATENPDFYIGRQFQYRFGSRKVDGVEYYYVKISTRQ